MREKTKSFVLIFMVFWLGCGALMAQDKENAESYPAPEAGSMTVEFNGNFFFGQGTDRLMFAPTYLKFRYFLDDKLALRYSTWFNFSSEQNVPESTLNFTSMAARPGAEYHFAGEEGKYSVYFGGELILDHATHNFNTTAGAPIAGAWDIHDIRNFQNRGFFQTGLVGVFGLEFYRGSRFYAGTEIGLGYAYTWHARVEYGGELFVDRAKSSTLRVDLTRMARIGYRIK
jgi:hypothetical protein